MKKVYILILSLLYSRNQCLATYESAKEAYSENKFDIAFLVAKESE